MKLRSVFFAGAFLLALLIAKPQEADAGVYVSINTYGAHIGYGYGYSIPTAADADADFHFDNLANKRNLNDYFKQPNSYLAILEEFDPVRKPQSDIKYADQVHIVNGRW